MEDRPNYYLLLDLDPSVDNWTVIEQRIIEKKRRWGMEKTQGNPAARRKAERNLSLIGDIELAMKDGETRRALALEARKELSQLRSARMKDLDQRIAVITGGLYSSQQLALLTKDFAGTFSEAEIKARLREKGLKPAEEASKPTRPAPRERLDQVNAENIRRDLLHLKLKSLYKLLDLEAQSSPRCLYERANERNQEILRNGLTDSDSNARKSLYGICLTVFRDEKEKAKYDATYALEAMEGLKPQLELVGTDKRMIGPDHMSTLLTQARQLRVPTEEAQAYIEEYAEKRGWVVVKSESSSPVTLLVCGFCSAVASSPTADRCQCGQPLRLSCPKCGTSTPTQDAACGKCGSRTGDYPQILALKRGAAEQATEGNYAESLHLLERGLLIWPDWSPLLEERRAIEAKRDSREQEVRRIESLTTTRKLLEARTILDRLTRAYGEAGVDALARRIREGVDKAEIAFREAQLLQKSEREEDAIVKYEEALTYCADHDAAQRAMQACPPPSPERIQVVQTGGGWRLTWIAPRARGSLTYRILRKAQGAPASDQDGSSMELSGTTGDDLGAEGGIPWYFAVYSIRGGVLSKVPARSGPHMTTPDVTHLELQAGESEAMLRWTRPSNCLRVEVWRKSGGEPSGRGDGVQVPAGKDSAHDTGLTNGIRYGYHVLAWYPNPDLPGRELASPGLKTSGIPISPPKPVADLRFTCEDRVVRLSWTSDPGITVQIRQSLQPVTSGVGIVVPASGLDTYGVQVPILSPGNTQVTIADQGQITFTAITIVASTAVIGSSVVVARIDDVGQLASQASGRNIVLTWGWPSGVDEVRICYTHSMLPTGPADPSATTVRVTRAEYDRAGCWELRGARRQRHYFAVFVKAPTADIFSAGATTVESMGNEVPVAYRVVLKRTLLTRTVREAWLELKSQGQTNLPGIMVVVKARNVPISPQDGRVILDLSGVSFSEGVAQIPIPPHHLGSGLYVKLFFKEPRHALDIRLLPARLDDLTLG